MGAQSKFAKAGESGKSGASASARSVDSKGSKGSKTPVVKKAVCLWRAWEPQWCDSCCQSTHMEDRDADPAAPKYLSWIKMNTTKNGKKKPSGSECHDCFYVRRSLSI